MATLTSEEWKRTFQNNRQTIQQLIKTGKVEKSGIAKGLGISLKKLDGFLLYEWRVPEAVWNFSPCLREISGQRAYSLEEEREFWNFIRLCSYYQDPKTKKNQPINFESEANLIGISLKYTRAELTLFEDIYWWLIRLVWSRLFFDSGKSCMECADRVTRIILNGEWLFYAILREENQNFARERYQRVKLEVDLWKRFQCVFLKYSPTKEVVPAWLWQSKTFPELKFAEL